MPLLKRKPVLMHPLPSMSAIVQPLGDNKADKDKSACASEASPRVPAAALDPDMPQDGKDDDEQLERLLEALSDPAATAPQRRGGGHKPNGTPSNGNGQPMPPPPPPGPGYRVKNVEVFYMPETGEVFLDYESFVSRRAFYDQQVFQCEVSGKSALSYFDALDNEAREVRQLHSRFPKQLRRAVLEAVNFQVEGKLETLADRVFERFVNRFFDDEKVFVDVQGDKYLARIVRTFPPKNLEPPTDGAVFHPYAVDLTMTNEEVTNIDDPMKYFYQVRLIQEGGEDGGSGEDTGEKFEGSVMEVQADKISRDRINFSRAMLKRFIRDCVARDAAIFSPWIVKKNVARRYGLPTEVTDETRQNIAQIKKRELEKRKRERDERLGITHTEHEDTANDSEAAPAPKKRKSGGSKSIATAAAKAEREKEREREREEREKEKERIKREKEEEEERRKKRAIKYPAEDLLVEYAPERDGPAGRIEVRPVPNKQLPFGEDFEKFFMTWSFLNVMGKPLGLTPFTIDDFEQALYHSDPYTSPSHLLIEVHAALLNSLLRDVVAGGEPVKALVHTGMEKVENDIDNWEGTKGASTDTIRAAAQDLADKWRDRELPARDNRKGWEAALVGCLWDRATLDVLPHYLDNILHLTFEDKPAPTRPTWSTGPSSGAAGVYGLVPAKPEKRYPSLHFVHKLSIIAFLVDLVSQTVEIRDYIEETTQLLTEVRKDQIEVRREQRRVHAELDALEPKEEEKEDDEGTPMLSESRAATPNGHHANGATAANTEQDELESTMGDGDDRSRASSPMSDGGRTQTGASRRRAMKEKAAEREAEEAMRAAKAAKEREELKAKKVEMKQLAAEKKKLQDEEAELDAQLKQLELDFRRFFYALRARPLGTDRFGNRAWWVDGLGSAPLYATSGGKIQWGTGRLYLQGADDLELELTRAATVESHPELTPTPEHLEDRRAKEEGEGRLAPNAWAVYDTPESMDALLKWLNPRGVRELHLLRALKQWWPEIEGGCRARRLALGLDAVPEDEGRRVRPTRRAAGDDDKEASFLSWKNKRAPGKD